MLQKSNLHPYQLRAIEYIHTHPASGLLIDMGLGKTVSTLTALEELMYSEFEIGRVLVIAPKHVALNTWPDEIRDWSHLNHLTYTVITGSKDKRERLLTEKTDIHLINFENLVWLCEHLGKLWPYDTVVIDELSKIKNPSTKRFKALRKIRPLMSRVIGLTGTPTPKGLIDLWSQVYFLDQGERLGKTIGEYRRRYFYPGASSGHIVYEYKLRQGADKEITDKISDICISMKAEDYLSLPKCSFHEVKVTMSSVEADRYKTFCKELIIGLDGQDITAANAAVLSNKLQQLTSGAIYTEEGDYIITSESKIEVLVDLVEASTSPILVGYNYTHEKERIMNAIPNAVDIRSSEDIKRWNSGEIHCALGHPASMGHGLNLQKGGHTLVWFSQTWSLELYQQMNKRLDRQGQKMPVQIYHIIMRDTIDERIMNALRDKTETQNRLMEAVKAELKIE
ncbi:SNF2-related protein [Porphyromonas cangingivalis]|uniref:SNF2-related protein n=1 Tax=Porphyromonas cangingivalis TaxID=36874 RepID=UPI00242A6623|nr:DEAD/DEAH box helicase [Porphyromonas cangingivalis]